MSTPFGLTQETIQKIGALFALYPPVEQAILYGSRAKGNFKPGSDIDLTLLGKQDLTQTILLKIMNDLDDLLLPYHIDLSIFRDISDQSVLEHIKRVGVVFYQRH